MTEHDEDDTGLEACFKAARRQTPVPSGALMARVLEDAQAAQGQAAAGARGRARASHGRPAWLRALEMLGGWPAGASLATATLVGVWLGAYPPAVLGTLGAEVLGDTTQNYVVDLMPGFEFDDSLAGMEGLNDV